MKVKTRLLMALKIWIVIYPSITIFLFLFGRELAVLPLYQRTFILTISLVPWMMFIGIPFIDAILRKVLKKTSWTKKKDKFKKVDRELSLRYEVGFRPVNRKEC